MDEFTLQDDAIHVWTASVTDHDEKPTDLDLLDASERARADRFLLSRHRTRFIQSHAFMRQVLATYSRRDARSLNFVISPSGKPALDPRLCFNMSHSADCCVIAVRSNHPVGIDVERLRELTVEVAHRFAASEQKVLAGLTASAAQSAFLMLWTHKEAVIKMLGVSLAENLDQLEFELDAGGMLRIRSWRRDRTTVTHWAIRRINPMVGYIAAIASAHPFRTLKQFSRLDLQVTRPEKVDRFYTQMV
jgi:4'-phosphopantetheinyl transferase